MLPSYYSGLDLGQSQDYTALAVLERTRKEGKCHFSLRHLQRFALGTRYTAVCDSLKTLFSVKPLGGTMLSVDATGVGKPVVDMIKGAKIRAQLKPIVITAGHAATFTDGAFHVPKKELVSTLQVLLQSRRLRIAEDLAEAKALVEELANFKVKVTTSANETFESWRERDHDDMLLALACAAWVGSRDRGRRKRPRVIASGGLPKVW